MVSACCNLALVSAFCCWCFVNGVHIFLEDSLDFFNRDGGYEIFTNLIYSSWIHLWHSFDVFHDFFCFSLEEIDHVLESSHDLLFTSADGVLKLDVVPRFSCLIFVIVDFPEILVVTPRAAPTSVVPK